MVIGGSDEACEAARYGESECERLHLDEETVVAWQKKKSECVGRIYISRMIYIRKVSVQGKSQRAVKRLGEGYLCDGRRKKKEPDKGRGRDIYDQRVMDVNM